MNKKIIAIALIIVMILCNSISVCADTTWNGSEYSGDGQTKNVTATYTKAASSTCYVTITWGSLKYKYDGKIVWDGEYGVYNGTDDGTINDDNDDENDTWSTSSDEDKKITIENRSDVSIQASCSFKKDTTYIDVADSKLSATYMINDTDNVDTFTLGTAADSGSGDRTKYAQVNIQGAPKGIKPVVGNQTVDLETEGIPVGTVTVTLSTQ